MTCVRESYSCFLRGIKILSEQLRDTGLADEAGSEKEKKKTEKRKEKKKQQTLAPVF